MYNYLLPKTADYTTEILSIPSQVLIPQTGNKDQVIHTFYGGGVAVVTMSNTSFFDISIQWTNISAANKIILMDLWHNPLKANGRDRTFYWTHPKDGHTYTARFMSALGFNEGTVLMGVSPTSLRIEGTKPA